MKPLRGSNRDASKAPNTKSKEKRGKRKEATQKQEAENMNKDIGESIQPKTTRKRKAEPSSQPAKIKGQKNWKQMSAASVAALEKVMDMSILMTLGAKRSEKKEIQDHLNTLKKSFLDHCTSLKVPGHKQKLEGHRFQEETKKSDTEKQILSSLEENLRAVLSSLEKNEQEMYTLEHQCSVLRNKLQDQEEEAKEIFQRKEAVLNLPAVELSKNETTLQARMRETLPDTEAETMAQKLEEILQNSTIQDRRELLELACKQVDQQFNPNLNPVTITHCLGVI